MNVPYMFFRYWSSGQADCNSDKAGESKQDESKVQVMDISQDRRAMIRLTTGGRYIGELQNHADQSHH